MTQTKAGFVALVGAPNAGKSTLMNQILGTKISIVSRKAQTTRCRIAGIYTDDTHQIVFIDTPGLFRPKKHFEKAMVASIWSGIDDADLVLILYDVTRKGIDDETRNIINDLKSNNKKAFLVLNKIDLIKKEKLLEMAQTFSQLGDFEHIFMVSALNNSGVDDITKTLTQNLPVCEWFYPEDQLTTIPGKLFAAEITREKIFNNIHDEIPYSLTVETDSYEDFKDGSLKIDQTIYIQRQAHKKIIIGKGGSTIKKIGETSRKELESILERKIHLKLFVKTQENWQKDQEHYQNLGLDYKLPEN